jgi:biopolymer transport protein ExbD
MIVMFGKGKHSGPKETEVDLNRVVTPMLDMTFQILFFLIMNFRLPTPEGQVDLKLPAEDPAAQATQAPDIPLDKEKSEEYRLRLLVFRNADDNQGTISGMTWRAKDDGPNAPGVPIGVLDPNSTTEKDNYYLKLSPQMYGLVDKLREYKPKEGAAKQPTINIECDSKLRYSELLNVMDVMRYMKFNNVGVLPIPKTGK